MAGWTKADFDANYWVWVHRQAPESLRTQFPRSDQGGFKARIRYHRTTQYPKWTSHWDAIIAEFSLLTTATIAVVGAGFAWGVEYLNSIGYAGAVGVEISDYVDAEKGNDERAEVLAELAASSGFPETDPIIIALADIFAPAGAGPRTTATIAKEDLLSNGSRNRLRGFFNNQPPEWIFTEDMIQALTPTELATWVTEINKISGSTVVHIVTGPEDMVALGAATGHTIYNPNGGARVDP